MNKILWLLIWTLADSTPMAQSQKVLFTSRAASFFVHKEKSLL
jgi:hypothetical protein